MRIITHNGPFHCDDVLATALALKFAREVFGEQQIIRTRDAQIIKEGLADPATVVVDVGGEYDPAMGNFDHHFVGAPVRKTGAPYAAAGLVVKEYLPLELYPKLGKLVKRVDLADNGVRQDGWSLSETIHKCNPLSESAEEFDRRFQYLVDLFIKEVVEGLTFKKYSEDFAIARVESDPQIIEWVEEYEAAKAASESRVKKAFLQEGPFVALVQYEPALHELAHLAPERKFFTIFPGPTGEWMVKQIPAAFKSPKGRKPLPEDWAGKRAEELDAVAGIEGCVFVHPARFIGGHRTLEGAIKMATLALSL